MAIKWTNKSAINREIDMAERHTDPPALANVQELRSFLGLVNYYSKFLPQLASTLAPLYQLLKKQERWHWCPLQKQGFEEAKFQLTSTKILTNSNPREKLVLYCDASPMGLVLCCPNGFQTAQRDQLHSFPLPGSSQR